MAQARIPLLEDKRIILAVTGSIAVYKAVDLASKLTQAGAMVDVIMTEAACRFVSPITFQAVTSRPVYTDMWESDFSGGLPTHIAHVGLGESADLMVVAPATANTIAKLALGLADNLVSVTALAARCPMIIAPAMDGGMYARTPTQLNLEILVDRDVYLIEPEVGRFASGLVGKGRFPETATLLGHIRRVLGMESDSALVGQKIVVTAGGTREPLDPVRYLTNRSSGKQGYAVAQAALDAGAEVVLISTANLPTPVGVTLVEVDTAQAMCDAVLEQAPETQVLIMAAAVADFRPKTVAEQKIKKSADGGDELHIPLVRTPDILMEVQALRSETGFPVMTVGFAAESEALVANAQEKLKRKGLDLLVANDITATDAGFAVDTNRVIILDADGGQQPLELADKSEIAESIIQRVSALLG